MDLLFRTEANLTDIERKILIGVLKDPELSVCLVPDFSEDLGVDHVLLSIKKNPPIEKK